MTKIWGHFGNQILSPKPFLARWKNACDDFQQDRSRDWQCPNNNCTLPQLGADMTHPAGPFCLAILQDPKVEKETLSSDQSASSVVRLGHSMVQSTNFLARSFCLAWHTLHSSRFDSQSLSNFFLVLLSCPMSKLRVQSYDGEKCACLIPGQQEKCKELLSHRHHLALHCMGWPLG